MLEEKKIHIPGLHSLGSKIEVGVQAVIYYPVFPQSLDLGVVWAFLFLQIIFGSFVKCACVRVDGQAGGRGLGFVGFCRDLWGFARF